LDSPAQSSAGRRPVRTHQRWFARHRR
jgi:hypothetical protein